MTTVTEGLRRVAELSHSLTHLSESQINTILKDLSDTLADAQADILAANQLDLDRMSPDDPKYDRLMLNPKRLAGIADDLRKVAELPSPLGKELEQRQLPQGMELSRISVPLGVVGIIYEARPNVTFDVFALCFKTGNALVLKGGSDAEASNKASVKVIHSILEKHGVDPAVVYLLPAEREAVKLILEATDYIDVIIPRGSQGLINYVREHARVPVIETGAGIVHTYVDESADLKKATEIVTNAKTRRVSVCNALDTLIIHEKRLAELPSLVEKLAEHQVEIFADEAAYASLEGNYPFLKQADSASFGTEFLDYKLAIKTVGSLDQALAHIRQFSSKHSEAIVSENQEHIEQFLRSVDAAVVYSNASTAFTDGAQFGLGAEIGISTQKLHARGPMALKELCSYKWVIRGSGQIREP